MTNSQSGFPSSQIRRTPQTQPASASASHPPFMSHLNPRYYYQPLSQPSTTDLPSTIQRPRSAAPSRNVSTTSLSTLAGANGRDRDREYWLPEYLQDTAYGVWVSQWKEQAPPNPSSSTITNGSTTSNGYSASIGSVSMRREASSSQTVPSSRNPSPHHHPTLLSHRGVAFDVTEKSSSSGSSFEPPLLPSRFNERDRCPILEILNGGMEAKFAGPAKGTDSDAASVRADQPIPSSCGIYYYEVSILARGNQGYSSTLSQTGSNGRFIGIGFCRSNVTLNRLPGWEADSWGYHGDDGHSFCCQGIGKTYGPTFTTGDVIGCCINFRKGIAFYTKNGVQLDVAFRDLTFDPPGKSDKGNFYPSIGLRTPGEHVRVNFGQKPFVFDIGNYVRV